MGTVYNEDGSINVTPVPGDGNTINLLLNQDKSVYRDNNQNFKLFLNPYIEIRPFKGMTIQSRLNASLGYDKKNYFQGIGSYQYYASDGPNASVVFRIRAYASRGGGNCPIRADSPS